MTTSADDIAARWRERRDADGPVKERMRQIRDAYGGDLVVPLPELDASEQSAVANLFQSGLDQMGMRIASTLPNLFYPPVRTGIDVHEKRSQTRVRANLGWWEANNLGLKMRRRARHLIGYSSTPVLIRGDRTKQMPRWEVRDPLTCYPASMLDPDDMVPPDCIFHGSRPLAWIDKQYPGRSRVAELGRDPKPTDRFDILEYVDCEETVLILLGKTRNANEGFSEIPLGASAVELMRVPNLTGVCPAVVPGRITLDKPMGQFDGMIGMYQMQAKLMALEVLAVQKGVFPAMMLVGRENQTPQIVGGWKPGTSGEVNIIKGGDYKEQQSNPGYQTNPTIDRIERNMRVTAGIPAEFGGESPGNVRTGKRGDAVLSAVVDFPVQEAQELLAASLQAENKIAVAIARTYWGDTKKSFYVKSKGFAGNVDYTPNTDFDTDNNIVTYSQAGADANALVIAGGQRVGIGTLSKRSFQELDPLVSDPELEHDRVVQESLEASLLSSIQTQAQSGAIPAVDLARIMELVVTDKAEFAQAVIQVQREAQERQAAQVAPTAPEAMPGLSAPGQGAEAGAGGGLPPSIEAPPQGAQNLSSLLSSLRSPQRTLPVERGAA